MDMFWPIPGLISCTGVAWRWGLLSHAQIVVGWLALSVQEVETSQRYFFVLVEGILDHQWSILCCYGNKEGTRKPIPSPPHYFKLGLHQIIYSYVRLIMNEEMVCR